MFSWNHGRAYAGAVTSGEHKRRGGARSGTAPCFILETRPYPSRKHTAGNDGAIVVDLGTSNRHVHHVGRVIKDGGVHVACV